MSALLRAFALLSGLIAADHGGCQSLYYVEPENASCPMLSAPTAVAPKKVHAGASVPGSISIRCGFGKGSYTVVLSSTDPGATFSPKSFLVNFGSLVGDGTFTVTFASGGMQTLSATITSNMGSPAVSGRFAGLAHEFDVARP